MSNPVANALQRLAMALGAAPAELNRSPNRKNQRGPISPYALTTIDLQTAESAVLSHERGQFMLSSRVFRTIERDDRVNACLNTRSLAFQGVPLLWRDPPDPDGKRDRKILESVWPYIYTHDLKSEVNRAVTVMGFQVGRLDYQSEIPKIVLWPHEYIQYDWSRRVLTAQVETVDKNGIGILSERQDVIPGDGSWILWTGQNKSYPWMAGLIRVLPQLVVFRQANMIDWSRHANRWGNPPLILESTSIQATLAKAYQETAQRLRELVGDSVVTLPNGAKLTILELSRDAWRVFSSFGPDFLDDCIAIAILGQNLTTRVTGGSFAAARTHDAVRLDYLKGDCQYASDVGHQQIAYPFYYYTRQIYEFSRVPYPFYDWRPPVDLKAVSEVLRNTGDGYIKLAQGIEGLRKQGIHVNRQMLCDRYDIPVLKIDEEPNPTIPAMEPGKAQPPGTEPPIPRKG